MQNKRKINKKTGFTLIELLVVIVIIGILSGLGIASFNDYQDKAKRAKLSAQIVQEKKIYQADCVGKNKSDCLLDVIKYPVTNPQYVYSAMECEQVCEDAGFRLSTVEELFWYAETGRNNCAWSWSYLNNSAQNFVRTYPMYAGSVGGCGVLGTGDVPRLITVGNPGYALNVSAAIKQSTVYDKNSAIMKSNCACLNYPDF